MNSINTENRSVAILSAGVRLEGTISIPDNPLGLVILVHGSGSSHYSSRNQYVAQVLQDSALATLVFDLLTIPEETIDLRTRHLRFDIDLLARRTAGVLEWLDLQPFASDLKKGLFGASIGAAAALIAAAELPDRVDAIVSRGGRPDLANEALANVQAPTLLIVGEEDQAVIDLNQQALAELHGGLDKKLIIVPGASHLFEEAGTLERAAELARDWFLAYLSPVSVH
jgi:putative phosphoribosyl transferase